MPVVTRYFLRIICRVYGETARYCQNETYAAMREGSDLQLGDESTIRFVR
jgi:hypothetical protein